MATYVPPKRATAYKFYVGLVDQSNTKLLKANPTIAAGDFQVSKDGGAFANLATLPSANPASSRAVMIDLSGTEMTADNLVVQCVDAAGAEWCDLLINIATAARQIDDLAYPATSGRSMVVDAAGLVDANMVKAGPSGSGTAQTAGDIIGDTNDIQTKIGTPAGASIAADIAADKAVDDAIKAKTDNLPSDPADQSLIIAATDALVALIGTVDTVVDAIKAKTDSLTFTVAGLVDANQLRLNGSAEATSRLQRGVDGTTLVTCDAGSTTTAVVASSLSPVSIANDQWNGKIMTFDRLTATTGLRGQSCSITDYVHATLTFTVSALTHAPQSGDTATIS